MTFHSIFSRSHRCFFRFWRDATEPVWDLMAIGWASLTLILGNSLKLGMDVPALGLWLPVWSTPSRWCHVVSRRADNYVGMTFKWKCLALSETASEIVPLISIDIWKHQLIPNLLMFMPLRGSEKHASRCIISAEILAQFSKDPRCFSRIYPPQELEKSWDFTSM